MVGYDISEKSLSKFESMGGQIASSVQEVARDADVLMSMVVNDAQTEDVLFGNGNAVEVLKAGSIVISGSTVPPAFASRMASQLAERNIDMIDCPVSGGVAGAEKWRQENQKYSHKSHRLSAQWDQIHFIWAKNADKAVQ